MSSEWPYHFARLFQVSTISLKSDFMHIFFMLLYMYIAPGQGQTTPLGQNFDVNRKALPFCPLVSSFKTISLSLNLYIFFS